MSEEQNTTNPPEKKKNPLVSVAVGAVAVISGVWIFIPEFTDAFPVVGWLDEAAALGILIACASYFGLDIKSILSKFGKDVPDGPKQAKGEVINDSDENA